VNTYPLNVGQQLARATVAAQRRGQPVTDRPGPLGAHQPRRDTEPGVVVDAGQRLGMAAVGEQEPADHVHLPQLYRRGPLPPFEPLTAPVPPDQPGTSQRAVDRRRRGQLPDRHQLPTLELAPDPPRPPIPILTTQLEHHHLDLGRHLMRARTRPMRPVEQTLQPVRLIAGQPAMQRLPRHPGLIRRRLHIQTVGDHRQHRLIPLLNHRKLPHAEGVSRISRNRCQPSAETPSSINRRRSAKHQPKQYRARGGAGGTRTHDPGIMSPLL
jgi:hypothetical protein